MTKKVFEKLNVLAFTVAGVGPMVCKTLAEHGATVVRVESGQRPCILRTAQPFKDGKPGLNRSGYFAMYNGGIHSFALNLKHARSLEITTKLVQWADVVVENYSPGAMGRDKLSYEDVAKINPGIIMISLSHQGQTGPHRGIPGYGSQLEGVTGLCHLTGYEDRPPVLICQSYPDFVAPPFGVLAIVAALDYKRRTGKGQYIDASEFEDTLLYTQPVLMDFMVNGRVWSRQGNKSPHAAPHGVFRCQGEDQWCAVAVETDAQWTAFCTAIGRPELAESEQFGTFMARKGHEDELNQVVEQWTAGRPTLEVMAKLQAAGVPAGVVQNSGAVMQDRHLKERGYINMLVHPEIGEHAYLRSNFLLSETPAEVTKPAPLIGEHTELVCREFLGMADEEFVELLSEQVFE